MAATLYVAQRGGHTRRDDATLGGFTTPNATALDGAAVQHDSSRTEARRHDSIIRDGAAGLHSTLFNMAAERDVSAQSSTRRLPLALSCEDSPARFLINQGGPTIPIPLRIFPRLRTPRRQVHTLQVRVPKPWEDPRVKISPRPLHPRPRDLYIPHRIPAIRQA